MVKSTVREYVKKRQVIENEINLLKVDLKELDLEYKEQLDLKAVKAALRILKVRQTSDEAMIDSVIEILDVVGDCEPENDVDTE